MNEHAIVMRLFGPARLFIFWKVSTLCNYDAYVYIRNTRVVEKGKFGKFLNSIGQIQIGRIFWPFWLLPYILCNTAIAICHYDTRKNRRVYFPIKNRPWAHIWACLNQINPPSTVKPSPTTKVFNHAYLTETRRSVGLHAGLATLFT